MPYKFTFDDVDSKFSCFLECTRCQGTNSNGNQCLKVCCIGVPYCWIHLESEKKLKIKTSTTIGGEKGLFAFDKKAVKNEILFRKGKEIVRYYGEKIPVNELENRYGIHTAPYAMTLKKNIFEDAACKRGIGGLINKGNSRQINVKLVTKRVNNKVDHIAVKAMKNIRNRQELFTSYGNGFILNENGVTMKTRSAKR